MKNNASVIVLLACLVTAVFIPMPLQAQDGNAYAAENRRAHNKNGHAAINATGKVRDVSRPN